MSIFGETDTEILVQETTPYANYPTKVKTTRSLNNVPGTSILRIPGFNDPEHYFTTQVKIK